MPEPPHKRARLAPPEGFVKTKPLQPAARPNIAFQNDFVHSASTTNVPGLHMRIPAQTSGVQHAAMKPPSVVKPNNTTHKGPQPLRAPNFGQKPLPRTPPPDLSRARAFKLADTPIPGPSSAAKPPSTTKPNVRSPLEPRLLRRAVKAHTPHLHLDSPLTPLGDTPRTASPAEAQRVPAPPIPPRPASPTPNQMLVPPRPPETPVRKPMAHKPLSTAKLLASVRKPTTPVPAAPLPGPPPLRVSTPPPPLQPLRTTYQLPLESPEKNQGKKRENVSISATRIARATDLTTAGGSAELLGVMLDASGRELRSAGEKELAKGLEITPTKPKSRRGGTGKEKEKGKEEGKLADRARGIFTHRRLKATLAHPEQLGPPKGVWRVLEVVHPSASVDTGFPSGGRQKAGSAVLLRCVKEGTKVGKVEETNLLLSACTERVMAGSLVRVWPPVVVGEGKSGKVLMSTRYAVGDVEAK